MMGKVEAMRVPTGIKAGEPLEESIRKIDACVRLYGLEKVFDRVREFRSYRWVGHVSLRENCDCLACRLVSHLFTYLERGFQPMVFVGDEIPREMQPIEAPLFTGREKFHRPKW